MRQVRNVHRVFCCTEKGCNKKFRSNFDLQDHKQYAFHCKLCGWGTDSPFLDAKRLKICEACWADSEPAPKKRSKVT